MDFFSSVTRVDNRFFHPRGCSFYNDLSFVGFSLEHENPPGSS